MGLAQRAEAGPVSDWGLFLAFEGKVSVLLSLSLGKKPRPTTSATALELRAPMQGVNCTRAAQGHVLVSPRAPACGGGLGAFAGNEPRTHRSSSVPSHQNATQSASSSPPAARMATSLDPWPTSCEPSCWNARSSIAAAPASLAFPPDPSFVALSVPPPRTAFWVVCLCELFGAFVVN